MLAILFFEVCCIFLYDFLNFSEFMLLETKVLCQLYVWFNLEFGFEIITQNMNIHSHLFVEKILKQ